MADATDPDAHEMAYLPPSAPPSNQGNTSAAWTTVALAILGTAIAAVAVLMAQVWLFWVGIGVGLLGIVIGKIMAVLGYGQPNPYEPQSTEGAA